MYGDPLSQPPIEHSKRDNHLVPACHIFGVLVCVSIKISLYSVKVDKPKPIERKYLSRVSIEPEGG